MKNLGTIVAAVFLGIVLMLYMCTFQVRFTEVAIKKTWGEPDKDAITEPGLKLKWPSPVQSVVVYDKRVRILEDRTEETRTIDGKNLLLTTFTLWRITDPVTFHTNFPAGVEDGEKKLRTTIITNKHAVTGRHEFSDFVSTDPAKRKIREIEDEMKAAVARDTVEEFGVEVVDFGIKKLGLPESVTTAIFESMKSHEEAKAERYKAEGEASAAKILADARAMEERIMAEVDQKVAAIQTEAERIVSEYYKEFDEYPALRIFLDKLRTVREALRTRTTLILTGGESPWDVFDEETRAAAVPFTELPPDRVETTPAGKVD
ncbi:MAG: SPFH domain-containing protein [Phycisphaerae bacterium]